LRLEETGAFGIRQTKEQVMLSDPIPMAPTQSFYGVLWSVLRLPTQIILTGAAVLLVLWGCTLFHFAALERLGAALSGVQLVPTVVAVLFFLVGLSFAAFLWWVVGRYFNIVTSGKVSPDILATLKDLPVGLPEGTVRAILALIVAVIGLPLLLFSHVLTLNSEISGYINGIIAGVFGYYFGSRTTGIPNKALNQIVDANGRAVQAESDRNDAQQAAADAQAQAGTASRAATFGPAVSKLQRDVSIGSTILDVIAPALPAGILPAGLSTALTTAKTALDAVNGVTAATATDSQQQTVQTALGALLGSSGSGTSALGSMISAAAPMLAGLGIPGLTPVSALVALLSVGVKLGSAEYQRWRARVLAAPLAHGLVEFGTVTPDDAHAALLESPIFLKAFAEVRDGPGFDANLADKVLRDNALDLLWQQYGGGTSGQPPLFSSQSELEAGLVEFDQALLASRGAGDIPDSMPAALTATLSQAKDPAMRPGAAGTLTQSSLNQIVNAASKASAPGSSVATPAHAAFDALVTLVGHARQAGVDLVGAMSEVVP
jgi:hypothetical protein